MKKIIKNNIKLIIGIIIGTVISGTAVYAATTISSSNVTYTSNSQSTVQGALDTLYTRANTWIDPSYIDFTTLATNTKKTLLASSAGICIKRNGTVSCFKLNNWAIEKTHIQQVFSDVGTYNSSTKLGCNVKSSIVSCTASDFYCYVRPIGDVRCLDISDDSDCNVNSDGSVHCY